MTRAEVVVFVARVRKRLEQCERDWHEPEPRYREGDEAAEKHFGDCTPICDFCDFGPWLVEIIEELIA